MRRATYDDAHWLADDALPETWMPFFSEMEARFIRYLVANRDALAAERAEVEIDLGHGSVSMSSLPCRERSRLDIRDELLRLPAADQERVHASIPHGVLDAYLLPPLDEPAVASRKGLFPDRN